MKRLLRYWKARLSLALQSDSDFVEAAYREILGRNADLDGLNHYRHVLRSGVGRTAVLLDMMRSEEAQSKSSRTATAPSLPSLRALRPDAYLETLDRTNGTTISAFQTRSAADFDWLEAAILRTRYYEHPGVWVLGTDADKRVIAEMLAAFPSRRPLELGCASGAVLDCLERLGIVAEGVEISSMAIERAS